MEQTFNKAFKVETYDVAGMQRNWRIVYFPTSREMMVVKSVDKAEIARLQIFGQTGIVLTRRQAPRSFPDTFHDSEAKPVNLEQRTVILKLSNEHYDFCAKFGNISAYLRMLIDQQIKSAYDKRTGITNPRTANPSE